MKLNTLHWRHNGHDSVSNHQPYDCLLSRLFRRRSKKTSKLRVTGLCAGNSPGPVNSPHKWLVTRKKFPFDDVIMTWFPFTIDHMLSFFINKTVSLTCCLFWVQLITNRLVRWLHTTPWECVRSRTVATENIIRGHIVFINGKHRQFSWNKMYTWLQNYNNAQWCHGNHHWVRSLSN